MLCSFLVSDLKIMYDTNNSSFSTMLWTKEVTCFASLLIWRQIIQNYLRTGATNNNNNNGLLLTQKAQKSLHVLEVDKITIFFF